MKLFVDITELEGWQGKLTGVPRVMDELAKRLSNREDVTFVSWRPSGYVLCDYPFIVKKDSIQNSTPKKEMIHIRYAKLMHSRSRTFRKSVSLIRSAQVKTKNKRVEFKVKINSGDTLFILADWHGGDPSFLKYIFDSANNGVLIAQMLYDLLPIVTPQYSGHSTDMLKNYSKNIYPLCKVMFSISENTKKDTQKWLKENKLKVPPIKVIRLGDDFSRTKVQKPNIVLDNNYILCVGTVEARKNHTLLYYTYKLATSRGIELPPIVIVGRIGWLADNIYTIITTDPQVNNKFIFLEDINDNELSWLYQNCLFSVYPSFYEGWGLPIAESILNGKVAIASNTSSMKEIAGEIIDYFNPASTEECLERLNWLLDSRNLKVAEKRLKKYIPYSWDKTYDIINHEISSLS